MNLKFYIVYFVFILFVIGALCGCKRASSPKSPNVLVISIESLRWDHVGCYGYPRPITPNIDRLARSGALFERAYAQCSWTKPSIATTFTSTYLSYHGATNPIASSNAGPADGTDDKRVFPVLRDGFRTMADFFSKNGYRSFGWTGNSHLWSLFGFGRGFTQYNARIATDGKVVKNAKEVILAEQEPWFAFIHIMTPHWEYLPPPKYRRYDRYPHALSINGSNWRRICDGIVKLTSRDIEHNVALYDGEIAFTDFMIGVLLDTLDKKGLSDRTVVVVMSDHGEEFMEHGGVGHGRSLYEEVIRVPLIIAGPGVPPGRRIEALAQNADLFPTLATLCGFNPVEGLQGLDLTPLIAGKTVKSPRKYVYSEVVNLHAVIGTRFKYLFDHEIDREELYDIVEDPGEKNNLAKTPDYRKIKIAFDKHARSQLAHNRRLSAKMGKARSVRAPEKLIRDLRALGYLK